VEKYSFDVSANRKTEKYTKQVLIKRTLWSCMHGLFRLSPRVFFNWRAFMLRIFGASVGRSVHIYNSAIVYMPWNLKVGNWSSIGEHVRIYNLGKISIGDKTTISQGSHLCAGTHDYTKADMPLLKPSIHIMDHVWICADVFIGPGITVGEGAVVGARAVVVRNVDPWTIVAGNPAAVIGRRQLNP